MGFWSYYFFLKLFLFYGGFIGFQLWPNLAFAVFVAVPLAQRGLRIARQCIAIPTGIALLYTDSYLPPIQRLFQTAGDLADFSLPYLLELLGRFINLNVIAALVAGLLVWLLLAHRVRMSSFVFLGLLSVPLATWVQEAVVRPHEVVAEAAGGGAAALSQESLTTRLNAFYVSEAERRVNFPATTVTGPDFDVILLHTCSLAWDDLAYVDQQKDRLFGRFDVLMTQFNSAASYSGPAVIRLLRASCGQSPHEALYAPMAPECSLISNLAAQGFAPQWTMNHDGKFGNFASDIERNLGLSVPLQLDAGAAQTQRAFDGEAVRSDYATLSRWWDKRIKQDATRALLYYNSASLHDGNLLLGVERLDAGESYRRRLQSFLSDVNQFFDLLEQSGRRVVVVLVPEHGAAVRGERTQISGLRELPTPAITHIPVGFKLIGPGWRAGAQQVVDAPTSYLALAELLARLTQTNPFADNVTNLAEVLRDLPVTDSVAENEGTVVMQVGKTHQVRGPDGQWSTYLGASR